jgi:phospho-2-dehydro-3-deoxyheptonate aldolase
MNGLINDPYLDGTFSIKGLRIARRLLLDINEMGLPAGCEFWIPYLRSILVTSLLGVLLARVYFFKKIFRLLKKRPLRMVIQ